MQGTELLNNVIDVKGEDKVVGRGALSVGGLLVLPLIPKGEIVDLKMI